MSDIIKITIGFNRDTEKIDFIDSDFMNKKADFKDPTGYTAQLIQMALEKWIRDTIGISCPECDGEFKEGWSYCPKCGWNPNE